MVSTAVERRVRRIKQYKIALAMRFANRSAVRVQALVRGVALRRKFGKKYSSDTEGDGPPKERKRAELAKCARRMRAYEHQHEYGAVLCIYHYSMVY